jgi:hypothetical protein
MTQEKWNEESCWTPMQLLVVKVENLPIVIHCDGAKDGFLLTANCN